jgi:hypothetical protein
MAQEQPQPKRIQWPRFTMGLDPDTAPYDQWVYRWIVFVLGLALLGSIIGAFWLALIGKSVPDGVIALTSAIVGALAGVLAPRPSGATRPPGRDEEPGSPGSRVDREVEPDRLELP